MPPKVIADAKQVENELRRRLKKEGKFLTPYDQSILAKKPSNGRNRDLMKRPDKSGKV